MPDLFSGCTALPYVKLHEGIQTIGNYAFYGCSNLWRVDLPSTVVSIGTSAFASCNALVSTQYAGTADTFDKIDIKTGNDILISTYKEEE